MLPCPHIIMVQWLIFGVDLSSFANSSNVLSSIYMHFAQIGRLGLFAIGEDVEKRINILYHVRS